MCFHGYKAGERFPHPARAILFEAVKDDMYNNVVCALLNAGTPVDGDFAAGVEDETPLMHAAVHDSIQNTKSLLAHKASLTYRNSQGENSLLLACKNQQWEAAKLIFDYDSYSFCADLTGETPFTVAKQHHCVELVQKIAAEMPENFQHLLDNVSLSDACRLGYDMIIKSSDIHAQNISSAVNEACTGKQVHIVQYLAPKLDDQLLAKHMGRAFIAGHVECMDAFLTECQKRTDLQCPDIISLAQTCTDKDFFNLTCVLTAHGRDVNGGNGEPLLTAAKHGNIKAASHLIELGAKVDQADTDGITPLLHACKNSNLEMVDFLVSWNADLNIGEDETPLTVACRTGHLGIVNRLLRYDVTPDLNKGNTKGLTCLEIAIENQHSVIAMNLMKRGAIPVLEHVSLDNLCHLGNTQLVSKFLEKVTSSQSLTATSLNRIARTDDNVPLLKLLINSDNVSMSSEALLPVLKSSCMAGSKAIVKLLINHDNGRFWASVKDDVEIHLHLAIEHFHVDVVQLLIDCGCDPAKGLCPLTKAIQSKEILRILLEYELPQSILNDALIAVCRTGHASAEFCAHLLLNKCANVNYCNMADPDYLTPLLAATLKSSVSLVRLLLSRGADPNITDKMQRTPLYIACQLEHCEISSLLIYNEGIKTDPNPAVLPGEMCPLWVACMNGYIDCVCLLLNNKASPNLINDNGQHVLQAAHVAGQHEVVRLLLEYGAHPRYLASVGLFEACKLGYFELAVCVASDATDIKLENCVAVSCTNGFSESGMGLILGISDHEKQKRCYEVWHQNLTSPLISRQSPPSPSHKHDSLWQCVQNKDMVQLKSLTDQHHDPNTKNAQGNPLLHSCIQNNLVQAVFHLCNCPLIDVNIKDEQGRTALFYSLTWPLVYVNGKKICFFDYLLQNGARVQEDNFGRTLLHKWAEMSGGNKISLDKLTEYIPLSCQDHKGHTPLHVAVLKGHTDNVTKLLELAMAKFGNDMKYINALCTVKDINALSPFALAQMHPDMCKCFVTMHPQLQNACKCDELQMPNPVAHAYFHKDFASEHRVVPVLNKLFHDSNLHSTLDLFRERFEAQILISNKGGFKKEFLSFQESVKEFMTHLSVAVEKEDPLFAFKPVLSGSCSEGTKVVAMNEVDMPCVFDHADWQECELENHERGDYTYMQLKNAKLAEAQPDLFSEKQLSVHGIFRRFYGIVRKHIATIVKAYPCLYAVDEKILHNEHAICPLKLAWSGKVLPWQEFNLDVVPAIPVPKSKVPGKLNHHEVINDIVVVPKWSACLIDKPFADNAFQLGFALTEKDLFYGMPVALRQGYKLAKVIMHHCVVINDVPVDESVSSYMLKCKTFECFAEMTGFQELAQRRPEKRELLEDAMEAPMEVLGWADKILAKLEHSFSKHHLTSFFLPGSNLVSHSMYQEDYRPLFYVRLCRAILHSPSDKIAPWRKLAQMTASQLLKPENLQQETFVEDIKVLRQMGLDENFRCDKGHNLMYYAISCNLAQGVQLLLDWQVSCNDVDKRGRSALEVAEEKKCGPAIIQLLNDEVTARHIRYFFSIVIQGRRHISAMHTALSRLYSVMLHDANEIIAFSFG